MTPDQHDQFLYFFSALPQFLAAFIGLSSIFFVLLQDKLKKKILWVSGKILELLSKRFLSEQFTKSKNQLWLFVQLEDIKKIETELQLIKSSNYAAEITRDIIRVRFIKHVDAVSRGIIVLKSFKKSLVLSLSFGLFASLWSLLNIPFLSCFCMTYFVVSIILLTILTLLSLFFMLRIIVKSLN